MYVCVSIKFLNLPQMFFLLTEHNVVATSLLPNWVMMASHFFSSVMLKVSAVWISCRREGTNSLFKKSLCKSQRPFSSSQCPAFVLLLLTVLLQERKRQEEGSCEPLERSKGVRAQTLSESQLQPPADILDDLREPTGALGLFSTAWQ